MRLVKGLVGGVIGAVVGVAIMVGLGVYVLFDVPAWPAIIIGLLTGLGVRLLAKSERPGPSYLCGAIAAALTLVAYFAAADMATKMMQAQVAENASKPAIDSIDPQMEGAPPVTAEEDEPDSAPDEEPATEEPATDEPATDEPVTDEPATDEPAADEPAADEGTTDAEDPAVEEVVVAEEVEVTEPAKPINVPRVMGDGKRPVRGQEFSILSFVLIGVGALIAYELGRSSGG